MGRVDSAIDYCASEDGVLGIDGADNYKDGSG